MAGIFLLFVMTVAVGSLLEGYVKELNRKSTTIRFSNKNKVAHTKVTVVEGDLFN